MRAAIGPARVAPCGKAADVKVIDYRMMGATGRVYLSGTESNIRAGAQAAEQALTSLQ